MSSADHQHIYDLAELCFRKGIRDVVICPGSRSAPLVLGFGNHPGLRALVIPDERSAGFIALGIAQATSKPVVLICTSGTAGLNFGPAIAEAFYQGIPLIVCTADRPPEWIGQQDGQTINQHRLYSEHVKGFFNVHTNGSESPEWVANRMMNEAILLCSDGTPGPVHLNFPFSEPLYPSADKKIIFGNPRVIHTSAGSNQLQQKFQNSIKSRFSRYKRIIIVAGQNENNPTLSSKLKSFLKGQNLVCITEITSNLNDQIPVIRHADAFLQVADENIIQDLKPDLIISFGNGLISKSIKKFLRFAAPKEHWHIQEFGSVPDTFMSLTQIIRAKPEDFIELLNKSSATTSVLNARKAFLNLWNSQEKSTIRVLNKSFRSDSEGSFVRMLSTRIPDGHGLHLANSLSVRYANLFGIEKLRRSVFVFSNRGTSGIDGCSSTTVGHQLAGVRNNILITGDTAFFYDRNAFWHNYLMPGLRIVVLNNQGGRIFGMIDGPKNRKEAVKYFIGKQILQAASVAREFGFRYYKCAAGNNHEQQLKDFFEQGDKPKLLEFISDPVLDKSDYEKFFIDLKRKYETAI